MFIHLDITYKVDTVPDISSSYDLMPQIYI